VDLEQFKKRSENSKKENRQYFNKLKLRKPRDLDTVFHEAHDETFAEMDCLACANCCKTTSPIFYPRDIDRASKAVGMKPGDFIEKYLRIDEDKDYVLQKAPCPFLGPDNYCSIYEDRPNACREYPHTNRKKMIQIMDLTYKNTLVCPAVLKIVEDVKLKLKL
jgi:Fe-S-cluster containining protein